MKKVFVLLAVLAIIFSIASTAMALKDSIRIVADTEGKFELTYGSCWASFCIDNSHSYDVVVEIQKIKDGRIVLRGFQNIPPHRQSGSWVYIPCDGGRFDSVRIYSWRTEQEDTWNK